MVNDRDKIVDIFSTHCTLEMFREVVAAKPFAEKSPENKARDVFTAHAMRGLVEVFRHLFDTNALGSLEGTDGHRINQVDAWENCIWGVYDTSWGTVDGNLREVADLFQWAWTSVEIYDAEKRLIAGEDLATVAAGEYGKLLDRIRTGNVRSWEARECYCFQDDNRYRLFMKDWTPGLFLYNSDSRQEVPISPINVALYETVDIEFKTGNLLIADYFRIPGFDEEFGETDYSKPSVNSRIGVELETFRHANDYNVTHVFVGGSSPYVLEVDGELVIGQVDFDNDLVDLPNVDGVTTLGRTSTQLRWVTIVEREHLAEILVRNSGCSVEEAEAKIEAYSKEYGVVSATIEPGTYTLYFSGDKNRFGSEFHAEEIDMPAEINPYFVVASKPLTVTEKPLLEGVAGPRPS